MNCPECGAKSEVLDCRQPKHLPYFRRRRECFNGHRFTTREVVAPSLAEARGFRRLPVRCGRCRARLPVSLWGEKHGCSTALVPVPAVMATEGPVTMTRFPDLAGGFVFRCLSGVGWWRDRTFTRFPEAVRSYLNSRDHHRQGDF